MNITTKVLLLATAAIGIVPAAATAQSANPGPLGPVNPQTSPEAAPVAPDTTSDTGPNDIIVTAQRRSERLEEVPIAITSIGGDTLAASNVNASAQLPQLVPSLRIDYSGAFAQPTIRGVGSATSGNGLAPNVATYIDGFYVPSALSNDFQLLSVTNVSVLKGPQGTLFGRNATGGAIQVTTRDPSHDTSGQFTASYARFDHATLSGYFTTGLSDNVAFDVAGIYERGDGFTTNIANGDKDWASFEKYLIRTKVRAELGDGAVLTFTYQHNHTQDPAAQIGALLDGQGVGTFVPGATFGTRRGEVSESFQSNFFLNVHNFYLRGDFDLGFADLSSYSMYRRQETNQQADYDHTSIPIFDYSFFYRQKSYSQEFILSSKAGGRLNWVVGANYFNDDDRQSDFLISLGGGPFFQGYQTKQTTSAVAVFADGTYEAVDRLFLTAGVRFSSEHRDASYITQSAAVGVPGSDQNDKTFRSVTPRAVVRYEIGPRTNVYASYSRGFKSGAFNPSGQNVTNPVDPETIDAFELGFKTASPTVRLNASAFYYSYRDLQIASYESSTSLLQNAANSRIWGGDIDAVFNPTPAFQLRASAAYTHAEFEDFPDAPSYFQCGASTDPRLLCNPADPAQFGLFFPTPTDSTGKRLPRTPRFSASLGGQYTIDFGNSSLILNADFYHTSRVYFDPVEQFSQKAYQLLNLRATYSLPGDKVQISLFGTNVTDTNYLAQVLPAALSIGATYGEPASYGAALSVKF